MKKIEFTTETRNKIVSAYLLLEEGGSRLYRQLTALTSHQLGVVLGDLVNADQALKDGRTLGEAKNRVRTKLKNLARRLEKKTLAGKWEPKSVAVLEPFKFEVPAAPGTNNKNTADKKEDDKKEAEKVERVEIKSMTLTEAAEACLTIGDNCQAATRMSLIDKMIEIHARNLGPDHYVAAQRASGFVRTLK